MSSLRLTRSLPCFIDGSYKDKNVLVPMPLLYGRLLHPQSNIIRGVVAVEISSARFLKFVKTFNFLFSIPLCDSGKKRKPPKRFLMGGALT